LALRRATERGGQEEKTKKRGRLIGYRTGKIKNNWKRYYQRFSQMTRGKEAKTVGDWADQGGTENVVRRTSTRRL